MRACTKQGVKRARWLGAWRLEAQCHQRKAPACAMRCTFSKSTSFARGLRMHPQGPLVECPTVYVGQATRLNTNIPTSTRTCQNRVQTSSSIPTAQQLSLEAQKPTKTQRSPPSQLPCLSFLELTVPKCLALIMNAFRAAVTCHVVPTCYAENAARDSLSTSTTPSTPRNYRTLTNIDPDNRQ